MAISIDWGTRVISILQADLTFVSGQTYELDTNWLRLQLKDAEDSIDGIVFPNTHNHNTEVSLSGVSYARIFEIINGFTVTFEEKAQPYVVNLTGSNNNILDVVNLGTVQINANNSAGLVNIREITTMYNSMELDVDPNNKVRDLVWGSYTADYTATGTFGLLLQSFLKFTTWIGLK